MKLTQGIYGYETDTKKTPFGFLNNQTRIDGVINSAGWFNIKGEKLGRGDLSMKDMDKIAKSISDDEAFFVLSELSSTWSLPSDLDGFAPGFDYIIENALWIIASKKIIKILDDKKSTEEAEKDNVKFVKITRDNVFTAFKHTPKPKQSKISSSVKPNSLTKPMVPAKTNVSPQPLGKTAITNKVSSTKPSMSASVPIKKISSGPKSLSKP